MSTTAILEAVILAVVIIVGAGGFGWFRILKTTNNLLVEQNEELKKQNEALKEENKDWLKKHVENEKAIAKLEGQVNQLTKIPLDEISESLNNLTITTKSTSESNKKIFKILEKSAIIAAEDRKEISELTEKTD